MKFSPLVLSALTLLVGLTEASKKMNSSMIQSKLNTMDKRSLLKNARKLEENADDEFVLSGNTNFRFSSCVSIEVEDEDEQQNDEDNENVQKIEQYIIVNMVGSDGKVASEYAIDIGTFLSSMGQMVVNQVESYCEVCTEAAEYCADDSGSWGQSSEPVTYYDSEEDKTVEFIDCNTCALYNCNGENDGENDGERNLAEQEEADMESAFDYLDQVGQCQEFSYTYSNQEYKNDYNPDDYQDDAVETQGTEALYIGYICNEDGTGIDLGFFYDEDCSVYTDEIDVNEQIGENSLAMTYLMSSQALIEGVFSSQHSCSNLEFANPFENQDDEGQNGGYQWYQTAETYVNSYYVDPPQANEACTETFEGDTAIALGLCDGDDETGLCEAIADHEANTGNGYWNSDCSSNLASVFDCEENQNTGGYDYQAWTESRSPQESSAFFSSVGGMIVAAVIAAVVAFALATVIIQRRNSSTSAEKKEALITEEYLGIDDKVQTA
jgi:hypothetical protein